MASNRLKLNEEKTQVWGHLVRYAPAAGQDHCRHADPPAADPPACDNTVSLTRRNTRWSTAIKSNNIKSV